MNSPFAVAQAQLETVTSILRERGPILQARPIRKPNVAVLYTDPVQAERARQLFDNIMRQRLERFAITPAFEMNAIEEEGAVGRALQHLIRAKPDVILVASTTALRGRGCNRPGDGRSAPTWSDSWLR